MGKEPRRLEKDRPKRDSPEEVRRLESEIERTRSRLDAYVGELDRRRHRLMAVRQHPVRAAGFAIGAAAVIAGAAMLVRRRSRRTDRARRRSKMLHDAVGRVLAHPERVASDAKSPWSRILVAVAPVAVKLLADAVRRRRR
jgi:hypothetical protein